ncbi:MAG: hypothetical protein ACI9LO_003527, partial [Planctomycetota bacterium]
QPELGCYKKTVRGQQQYNRDQTGKVIHKFKFHKK